MTGIVLMLGSALSTIIIVKQVVGEHTVELKIDAIIPEFAQGPDADLLCSNIGSAKERDK